MSVYVEPIPHWYTSRGIKRFLPYPPPTFDGEPTQADMRLALELIEALDPDSRRWYQYRERSIRKLLEGFG